MGTITTGALLVQHIDVTGIRIAPILVTESLCLGGYLLSRRIGIVGCVINVAAAVFPELFIRELE